MKVFDSKDFKSYFNTGKNNKTKVFEKETFWILQIDYSVEIEGLIINGNKVFRMITKRFGKVDFYPKSNRLHIQKQNRWINGGLQFIITNFTVMQIRNEKIESQIKKLKIGDGFKAIHSKEVFSLQIIITKQMGKKLPEPLFQWKYENQDKTFTNRVEDIRRAFLYKNWVKI